VQLRSTTDGRANPKGTIVNNVILLMNVYVGGNDSSVIDDTAPIASLLRPRRQLGFEQRILLIPIREKGAVSVD